jgi:hypothetical protein
MAAAVNKHNAMPKVDQRSHLVSPIATVAEATMQQDYWRAGAVGRVPEANAVVADEALRCCDRERRSPMRLKTKEIIVV